MKILMLAWRDLKNPLKGGAEVVTDIYLKGLVKKGHEVTLFSSRFEGSLEKESIDGYKIIRKGGVLGVYFKGLKYAYDNKDRYDIIIDQVNTVPFFTPFLIPNEKRIGFFHQLCLNVWFWETPFPVNIIGNVLERIYLKIYKNTRCFVVSESTKQDLIKYCWNNKKNILVLDNQIDFSPKRSLEKKENYFIFCGRLKKSKRVHDCIKALSYLKNDSKLYIIGSGDEKYKKYLDKLIRKYGLENRVIFSGKITNEERNDLMSKAMAILVTSVREGWGLIVTEANANGTVAITYDIHGLRDANKSGFITNKNNPKELARFMNDLSLDNKFLQYKSDLSLEFSKSHSDWENNTIILEKWIKSR